MSLESAISRALGKLRQTRPIRHTDRGREITASCPFHHSQKQVSFSLNLDTGLWLCRAGCGGGWIKSLLLRLGEHHSIIENELRGITPPKEVAPQKILRPGEPHQTHLLPEEILGIFHRCPTKMLDDGWPMEILELFEVGYDITEGRIIYPVRNLEGKLVQIFGRSIYPIETPHKFYTHKDLYGYAPDTYRYPGRSCMYNAHRVINTAGPNDTVVICEGFKEVMRLHMAGIHAIALMGAKWSIKQEQDMNTLYHRTKCNYVVLLDNDETGRKQGPALCKTLSRYTRPKISFTTEVKDVGDLKNLADVQNVVDRSQTLTEYQYELQTLHRPQ